MAALELEQKEICFFFKIRKAELKPLNRGSGIKPFSLRFLMFILVYFSFFWPVSSGARCISRFLQWFQSRARSCHGCRDAVITPQLDLEAEKRGCSKRCFYFRRHKPFLSINVSWFLLVSDATGSEKITFVVFHLWTQIPASTRLKVLNLLHVGITLSFWTSRPHPVVTRPV